MIKIFKTVEEYNNYTNNGNNLISGCLYVVEDLSNLSFYTNDVNNKELHVYSLTNDESAANKDLIDFIERDLTSIVIPNGTKAIGARNFFKCNNLTSVTIPDSVKIIGKQAFAQLSNLTSINLPEGLEYIGEQAFTSSPKLDNIVIPSTVKYIGNQTFGNCPKLKNLTLSEGLTTVGNASQSFASTGITSLTVPASVTEWGLWAFGKCKSLVTLTLEDGLTTIGEKAFKECTGLTSVVIPDSVTTVGQDAFNSCTSLTSATVGSGITDFGSEMFLYCTSLSDVTLKEGLTKIGYNMFGGCTSLSNITIPNSVTSLDYGAFHGCTGLTEITIPKNVTSIGDFAFEGCNNLKKIIMESSTPTTLGDRTFNINANDWYIYVPNDSVDAYKTAWAAYENHIKPTSDLYAKVLTVKYNITRTEYPSMLYSYDGSGGGEYGGGDEYGGTSTTLPFDSMEIDGVKQSVLSNVYTFDTVGEHVVKYTLTVDSEGETTLPNQLFNDTASITEIIIPKCVSKVYSKTFAGTNNRESLNTITVMNGNEYYDSRDNCNAIIDKETNTLVLGCKNTVIPNTVTTIGEEAFAWCDSLTSITIPNSVTSIGVNAFYGCSNLTSVIIPSGVTSIGGWAFTDSGLSSVTIKAVTPPILDYYPFGGTGGNPTIYVPSESVEAYKTADGWSNHANLIQGM